MRGYFYLFLFDEVEVGVRDLDVCASVLLLLRVLLRGELASRGRTVVSFRQVVIDLFVFLLFHSLHHWPYVLALLQDLAVLGLDGGSSSVCLSMLQKLHLFQSSMVDPAMLQQLLSVESLAGRVVETGEQEAFALLAQPFRERRVNASDNIADDFLEVDS